MLTTTTTLVLAALAGFQQQTDTTLAVPAGARLQLSNRSGVVRVTAWDRPEMRVRAEHGSRDVIEIETRESVIRVKATRDRGIPVIVDYDITVPRSMGVILEGIETEMTVEGVGGDIEIHTIEGDVTVRGAGGQVSLHTVEGDVVLEGGQGRINVDAVEGEVRITGAQGDLGIETVEGDVSLEDVESGDVDVGTVEGTVRYAGAIRDGGRYRLSSHEGDIELAVAAELNAMVSVATFEGSFEADPSFQIQVSEMRPGRRFSFTTGTGSARIELETFEGEIRIERR
jgi:DUF4097 and DUF4098 domain-containing protein YvlB